jgi:hypothetical protein
MINLTSDILVARYRTQPNTSHKLSRLQFRRHLCFSTLVWRRETAGVPDSPTWSIRDQRAWQLRLRL